MNQQFPHPATARAIVRLSSLFITFLALLLWSGAQGQAATDSPQPAAGATWYVDAAVPAAGDGRTPETAVRTIPEGLALAAAGDTVLVAAGAYTGTQTVDVPAQVSLRGAGAGGSTIEGGGADPIVRLAYGGRLEGFTVRGGGSSLRAVVIADGGAAVVRNRVEGAGVGIEADCGPAPRGCTDPVEIAYNVLAGIDTLGISVWADMAGTISHNTIKSSDGGIKVFTADAAIMGNLVLAPKGIECTNDAVWGYNNTYDKYMEAASVSSCAWGGRNDQFDPLLRDAPNNDFRLTAGSPMRGRGPGGSDIGALPFAAVGQWPVVTMTPIDVRQVRVEWSNSGAASYDLFVGVSPDEEPYESEVWYKSRTPMTGAFSAVFTRTNPLTFPLIAVSAVDAAGAASELALAPQPQPTALENERVEQDHPLIWPDSYWKPFADPQASGGTYIASDRTFSILLIPFVGDTLVVGRSVGPIGGEADILVDGLSYGTLDNNFVENRWQVPAYLSGFGPGPHLLTLRTTRVNAPQLGGANVDFVTVPSPIQPSAAQLQAVERVNFHRQLAGLRLLRGNLALHLAAQSHADYYARNGNDPRLAGLGFHDEYPDLPGFTGEWPWDRASYFGYGDGAGENGGFYGNPIRSVDGWMASVYHRNLIMCYGCRDVGYGMVNEPNNKADSLSISPDSGRPQERLFYTYPGVNQTNVPTEWRGGEIPEPLPGVPRPVGYPISLYIQQTHASAATAAEAGAWMTGAAAPQSAHWSVTTAELRTAAGVEVPVYMLDQNTDKPKVLGPDVVFLIPHKPLAKDTTYYAHIAGTDSGDEPFDYRWSFSTGGSVAAPDLSATSAWSEPLMPQAEGTITDRGRLANSGLGAEGVTVRATLPEAATYVPGSASTSQGSVSGAGPLDFVIGSLPKGGSVEIRYSIKLMAGIDLPRVMSSDVTVSWDAGQMFRRISAFAGAKEPVFLPAVVR